METENKTEQKNMHSNLSANGDECFFQNSVNASFEKINEFI